MNILQLSNALKPLIQQARSEDKVFFHKKISEFITPDELELALNRGDYAYWPEEWELVDPSGPPPWYYKLIADEGKENAYAILLKLSEKLKRESNQGKL